MTNLVLNIYIYISLKKKKKRNFKYCNSSLRKTVLEFPIKIQKSLNNNAEMKCVKFLHI